MNSRQIELVQSSFDQVLPIADTAADVFYKRLFELDPSLRVLFRGDMKAQGKKLMDALSIIVGNLRRIQLVIPGIRALATRHVAYGVKKSDYATVGQALIDTLQVGLGGAFTAEVSEAWLAAYTLLAGVMKSAAEETEATMAATLR